MSERLRSDRLKKDPSGKQMVPTPEELTQLLVEWSNGEKSALDKLVPFVYEELRRLARHSLSHERKGHTLQTTALVHEAYLRLVRQDQAQWQNRAQFFAISASMVRRILVDHARASSASKRAGKLSRITLDEAAIFSQQRPSDVLALDDALERLAVRNERAFRIVELKFFGGLTAEEIGEVLKISAVTVMRDWAIAKAWLYRELGNATTEAEILP
jgi:RNA polymerase sigma factor (TIGR02999 family)